MNAFDDELDRQWDRKFGRMPRFWYFIPFAWILYFGCVGTGFYIAYHILKGIIR
jgi:hypothetical protein